MATPEDVQKLAALARLSIEDEKIEKFSKEFESILSYISQINNLKISKETKTTPRVRNIFREDENPHAPGLYTEKLAEQFPERKGNALSVKQIITHD